MLQYWKELPRLEQGNTIVGPGNAGEEGSRGLNMKTRLHIKGGCFTLCICLNPFKHN